MISSPSTVYVSYSINAASTMFLTAKMNLPSGAEQMFSMYKEHYIIFLTDWMCAIAQF